MRDEFYFNVLYSEDRADYSAIFVRDKIKQMLDDLESEISVPNEIRMRAGAATELLDNMCRNKRSELSIIVSPDPWSWAVEVRVECLTLFKKDSQRLGLALGYADGSFIRPFFEECIGDEPVEDLGLAIYIDIKLNPDEIDESDDE